MESIATWVGGGHGQGVDAIVDLIGVAVRTAHSQSEILF